MINTENLKESNGQNQNFTDQNYSHNDRQNDKTLEQESKLMLSEKRIQKTENILSAMLLVVDAYRKNTKDNRLKIGQTSQIENVSSGATDVLLSKVEEVVYKAVSNYFEDRSKVKDNLSNIVFYINALKIKNIISDDNHMSLILAYTTIINAYETIENYAATKNSETQNGTEMSLIKDIDLKLEEVEDIEDFKLVHSAASNTLKSDSVQESKLSSYFRDNSKEGSRASVRDSIKKTNLNTAPHNNVQDARAGRAESATTSSRVELSNFLSEIKSETRLATAVSSFNRQNNRRSEILKILSREPITIKDISQKVLGCSEKTIQRELNSLLEDRLIERIGEKRWSRYAIA